MTQNTNKDLIRANKLTIKTQDGRMQADFYRTHKHLLTVTDNETGYSLPEDPKATASFIREDFRTYCSDHADQWGIKYDPADRRTEDNLRPATYSGEGAVMQDAEDLVKADITRFYEKMPNRDLISHVATTIDTLTPKTKTSTGNDLTLMGIEDGKYVKNGNLAWFDLEGTVTLTVGGSEIYVPIKMELVSGQLKKFRMTQTEWNASTKASLLEIGAITEEDTKKKKEDVGEKVGLGDEEHEGLHTDDPATDLPKPKRTRKAKAEKSEEGK